jgi:protein-disulfide isomerase
MRSAAAVPDSSVARADLARIQGSVNAPVWVIVVSDFQCPYCKEWHDQAYKAFRDEFVTTGKVRMAYVNFPLNSHINAWPSAESAMCAAAQGKFWEMHDALFETQTRWETMSSPAPLFDSLARTVGVDLARWRDCVTAGKMKALIQADHDRAAKAGAGATPSFLIGDKILAGAQPIDQLRVAIDSALAKSKKTKP